MHEQIASFPSDTLYGGKLIADESVAAHLLTDLPNTSLDDADEEAEVLGTPVVFFDTAGCEYFERLEGDADEGSHCNENEATVVKNWVERLVSGSVSPSQIAIITPFVSRGPSLSFCLMNLILDIKHRLLCSPYCFDQCMDKILRSVRLMECKDARKRRS